MEGRPWWTFGTTTDYGYVYAMTRKQGFREPVLLDAAEASDDETRPLYADSFRGLSYAPNVAYVRNPPKDFRAGAILSAIFCFFPLGFFAIYYSYRVQKQFHRGDLSGSITASERTRLLINLTLLVGSLLWFGGIIGIVLFANRLH
ncbi:synapse differentiation-inducing gene protein 1-like isoform X2 [Crassostrea virginica]|uniref:Synapse differentiation-inducing gene protein 1-like isoform X2 n=1 Tax=Crassostrea virginica TaxID=6565 RepID=A0A8B8E8Q3_CRAVI|nr:synapse differentiation-inducing gene protein 1-like isoform X2 [Crassostrea virginica]